jgi:hypothetical protein
MRKSERARARLVLMPALKGGRLREGLPVTEVEAGQIYCKTELLSSNWEVIATFDDDAGVRHVRLRNVADTSSEKLIAEKVLRNPRFFRRIGGIRAHAL